MQKKIKTGMLSREIAIERDKIDQEARTVELSFSSEAPVERYFGYEILSHDEGAMRMDRLNNGAPLLLNHNTDEQIGVVDKAYIGPDRKGRALVRFSRSQRAEEIFKDVIDGIRKNVSVGYLIHSMKLVEEKDEESTYLADDWEPLEISTVPVPADNSVGVGRAAEFKDFETILEKEGIEMPDEKKEEKKEEKVEINERQIRDDAVKAEQTRTREIMAIGEKHELRELAKTFIDNGKPLEEFRTAVLDELEKRGKVQKVDNNANIGMNEREVSQFSFLRVIKALASGKREQAAFEFEVSEAAEKKLGKSARGILVPFDVLMHRAPVDEMMKRVLTVGTANAGGNLKGTDFLAASFIELLRNKMLIKQLGAITLDGLVGDVVIPSQTGGCTAYWVAENTNITSESAPTFGQATMIVHTMGAYVDIARKLLLQSSPSVDQLIRNDLIAVLAREADRVAINGAHASAEPNGILNTSGIGSVAGGTDGAAPTADHIIDLETEVAIDNADVGSLAYLTNPKVRGKLKKTFTNTTYGEIPVWGRGSGAGVGDLNGYNAYVTNQVPSNLVKNASGAVCSAIIFGNFADLIMGFWGALDINVDTASLSKSGGLRVVAFQDMDVAVRIAASFAAMKDALTT